MQHIHNLVSLKKDEEIFIRMHKEIEVGRHLILANSDHEICKSNEVQVNNKTDTFVAF